MEAASTAKSMFKTAYLVLAEHGIQIDPATQDLNTSLGKDATPSQLRSLIMSRGTDQMLSPGSKARLISEKDIMTVGQIMGLLDNAVADKERTIGEYSWELALKIRIQASDALEAVGAGCMRCTGRP